MFKFEYEVVHDCDEEDGTPSCWSTKDPNGNYWWIDLH